MPTNHTSDYRPRGIRGARDGFFSREESRSETPRRSNIVTNCIITARRVGTPFEVSEKNSFRRFRLQQVLCLLDRNMSRPQQEYVDPYEPGAQFVQQTRTHAQHPGHPQRGNFATSSTSSLAPPSMSRNASDPSMSSGALALQQLDGTLQSQRRMSGPPASPPGHVITHQGVTGQSYTDVSDIHSSTSHALQANADAFFGHAAMGVSVRSNVGPALGPSIGPTGTRLPAAVHPPPGQPIGLSAYSSTGPHGGSSAGQFGVASVGPPGVSRLGMSSGVVRPGQRQYSSGAYHAGSDARQSSMQQFAGRLGNEGIGSRLPVGVGGEDICCMFCCLSVCLSVCLFVCLFVFMCVCLLVYLCYMSVCQSVCVAV